MHERLAAIVLHGGHVQPASSTGRYEEGPARHEAHPSSIYPARSRHDVFPLPSTLTRRRHGLSGLQGQPLRQRGDFFFKEAEARRKPKRQICGAPFRFRDMRELRVSALEGLGPPSARSPRSPRSPISPRSPRGSSTSFLSSFDRDEMVVAAHDRMMYNRQRSQVRTASTATHATHCGHTDGTCPCSAAQAPHAAGGALQRQ